MDKNNRLVLMDAGNTSIKFAEINDGLLSQEFRSNSLKEVLSKYPPNIPFCICSSRLKDPFLDNRPHHVVKHTSILPIQLRYDSLHTLGTDRIAAACGCFSLFPNKPSLVIDMGTCMTIDFISAKGNFEGGIISPGLTLRMRAMSKATTSLPDISNEWMHISSNNMMGKTTKACLLNGSYYGMLREIEGVVTQFKKEFTSLNVIIMGGDAQYFESKVKAYIFAGSELIFSRSTPNLEISIKPSVIILLLFGLLAQPTYGQSIYSYEGFGSINHQGMPNNFNMGEVGVGSPSPLHINTMNPALLVFNNFSTFQVGVELDNRRFSGDNISGNDVSGSLRYLGYSFPIMMSKWVSSFGILPFSNVDYNTYTESSVVGAPDVTQIINNRGTGGLTSLFWSNGFRIKKNLMIGVKGNFIFGNIEKESTIFLQQITVNDDGSEEIITIGTPINYLINDSYKNFNFLIGLAYSIKLSTSHYLNLGLTFQNESNMNIDRNRTLTRLSLSGTSLDNQDVLTESFTNILPTSAAFGISYQYLNHFMIGFDFERQNWADASTENSVFNHFSKVALGVEWIPDYDNINSYLLRSRYSMGLNRIQLPYLINNQSLLDLGINFGVSLPISGFSTLDLGMKFGSLGKISDGMIRENYYKIVLGVSLNDRWFVKRKYD